MKRTNAILLALLLASNHGFAATNSPSPLPELLSGVSATPANKGDEYRVRVTLDVRSLYTLAAKSEVRLTMPGIGEYVVVFDEAPRYPAGVREWRGHLKGADEKRVVLITRVDGNTSGYLQTPAGNYKLGYLNGTHWLVADRAARQPIITLAQLPEILGLSGSATGSTVTTDDNRPAKAAYAVEFNIAALSSLQENTETSLTLPDAGTYKVIYERTNGNDSGTATWVGYLRDYGNDYRVLITYGPNGAEGQILTPHGEYLLQNIKGKQWLVDVNKSGLRSPDPGHSDAVVPETAPASADLSLDKTKAGAARGSTVTAGAAAAAPAASALADGATTVDVLVLYTPGLASRLGQGLQTRIDQLVALSNQAYRDSGVGINLRLVGKELINYTDASLSSMNRPGF